MKLVLNHKYILQSSSNTFGTLNISSEFKCFWNPKCVQLSSANACGPPNVLCY